MSVKFASLDAATIRRFIKFLLVGLVNTGFGYAVYAVLVLLGLTPQVALLLSFAIGVLWNYLTTARFVFEITGFGRLPAYCICYVFIYALNAGILQFAIDKNIEPLLAQAVLTPIFAVITFALLSRVLPDRT
nr:GtrA family protein [Hyphomonas sp. Mor2]